MTCWPQSIVSRGADILIFTIQFISAKSRVGMKTTIVDAIRQVMKAEGEPMTVREIYYQTMQKGLYEFKAKDPIDVIGSQIRKHCIGKHTNSYPSSKFFKGVGNYRYQLLSHPVNQNRGTQLDETASSSSISAQHKQENGNEPMDDTGLAKRTIILAIREVMQTYGKPMTVQQVYEAIVSRGLYTFKATQPVHVVRSQIRRHCFGLDYPTAADLKHFEIRGKDKYYFLPKPIRQRSRLSQVGTSTNVKATAEKHTDSVNTEPRNQVFISYCHRDSKWLQRLQIHLRPIEKLGVIETWDDTRIRPGAKWRNEIEKAIKRARVAVMLISADFLASEFIIDNELAPLLQAAASEGAMILPVIISPCRFEKTEGIRQFQAVNPPSKPLSALNRTKREEIFVKVADAVEAVLYPL